MLKTILIVLSLCTLFFGIIGSIQADSFKSGHSTSSISNSSISKRPPLGDDGPGGDDDGQ